jgi:hypothetical protein
MKTSFCSVCNEIQVLKQMFKDSKLKSITNVYVEPLPLKNAFPAIISLVVATMTIPLSSTTCERTFSKMKLIKITTRNTMSDIRLNDFMRL